MRAGVLVIAMLVSSVAVAQAPAPGTTPPPTTPPTAAPPTAAPPTAAPPAHRPVPDYDGRGDPPTTFGDVARGVVRVVLFPVRIVIDYGVRWPLGKLITAAEHSRRVRSAIRYLFLSPPAPTMSVYPIAFYDFGFQSSIGVRFSWTSGFLTPGSKFGLKLGTGGADWWRADGTVVVAAPARFDGLHAGIDGGFRRRPDQQFFGLGPRAPQAAVARYLQARMGATAFVGWPELSLFVASMATFAGTSNFADGLSVEQQITAGRITAEPPGYRSLVVTQRVGGTLALDTRGRRPDTNERDYTSSGVRLDAVIERVRDREIGDWLHVDATLGGALRLDRTGEHKLDLRMRIEMIQPLGVLTRGEIPFVELASVGGSRDLRGFASGRGRDLSAAAFMLDYQWPLAAWLDATLYLSAGNVFGQALSGFSAGTLRASAGMGLALAGLSPNRQVELWSAVGTDPFDAGAEVTSFRLVLGYSRDY